MVSMKWIRGAAVALATLGMTIPNAPAIAAGPTTSKGPSVKVVNTRVFDISLSNGGTFKGRVVDHTGSPLEGAEVSVKQNSKVVGRAVSDKSGTFAVANLKAGIYTMSSGNTEGQFRTWAENTAPPTAKDQGLLVMGENGARGNYGCCDDSGCCMIAGAIGAAALIVGIVALVKAGQNHDVFIPVSP